MWRSGDGVAPADPGIDGAVAQVLLGEGPGERLQVISLLTKGLGELSGIGMIAVKSGVQSL